MDEKALILKAKDGSRSALEWLIKLNTKKIMGTIVLMTKDEQVSQDIFQEMCVKIIRSINGFNGDAQFSTWAIQIAKNCYRDNIKRQKVRNKHLESQEKEVNYYDDCHKQTLLETLSSFTTQERQLVLMKHHYGYTYEEIACKLGIPAGTVRSRLHHILKQFKEGK